MPSTRQTPRAEQSAAATTPQERANEPWPLLGTLPSTNWKTASGTGIAWLTMLFYFALAWTGRDVKMNSGLWDSWLYFVAIPVLGVSAAQYVGKRMTFKPGSPDAARGAASQPSAAAEAERGRGAGPDAAGAPTGSIPMVTRPLVDGMPLVAPSSERGQ